MVALVLIALHLSFQQYLFLIFLQGMHPVANYCHDPCKINAINTIFFIQCVGAYLSFAFLVALQFVRECKTKSLVFTQCTIFAS